MRTAKRLWLLLTSACLVLPAVVAAENPAVPQPLVNLGAVGHGRLLKDGKPVVGAEIHLWDGKEDNGVTSKGQFDTTTDGDGVFVFHRLPTNTTWRIMAMFSSLKGRGFLPPRKVHAGSDGKADDWGDFNLVQGLRLSGTVKTREGGPIPPGIKFVFSSGNEGEVVIPDDDGRFVIGGIPPGEVEFICESEAFRLSGKNRSLKFENMRSMIGLIEKDKDDLLVLIERGIWFFDFDWHIEVLPQQDRPENRPLAGAELSGPSPIVLAGRVVDDQTGQPVLRCKILPGYQPPPVPPAPSQKTTLQKLLEPFGKKPELELDWFYWITDRAESISNGLFSFEFVPLSSKPLLRIEADGYQPCETEASSFSVTNLLVRLKKGNVNGIVLLPDGTPAENASVVYGTAHDHIDLIGDKFRSESRESLQATGKDGKFLFSCRPNGMTVFATHPSGWAEQTIGPTADKLQLRLQPWATVTGTIVNSNGSPATGVYLSLQRADYFDDHGSPKLEANSLLTTDARGHFQFSQVAPGLMSFLFHPIGETNMPAPGYLVGMQGTRRQFLLAPGITNDLGKIPIYQDPPPGIMDQLKKKLGL